MEQDVVKLTDLAWYNEEEKDELFDVSGQFKVAALILSAQMQKGKQEPEQVKSAFLAAHKSAFDHLNSVAMDEDKAGVKEFIEEKLQADHAVHVLAALGLE